MRLSATSRGMKIPVEVTSRMSKEKICTRWREPTMAFELRMTKSCPAGRESRRNTSTTSDMVREWKTFRVMVSRSTMKGKNDRMALAATEKAKVWTSV